MTYKLLRLPAVREKVGLCTASIYSAMRRGDFPRNVSIGPNAKAWPEHEIDAWIEDRIRASREERGAQKA